MSKKEEHIVSPLIYIVVLIALMGLLVLTLIATFVDLDKLIAGPNHQGHAYWNMAVALLIAILKALLIIMFFMHIKYSPRLTWPFAVAGFVWLGILLTLTMSDYTTRNYPPSTPKSGQMEPATGFMRTPP
jgi:cytochrome c oxidase subunit 4